LVQGGKKESVSKRNRVAAPTRGHYLSVPLRKRVDFIKERKERRAKSQKTWGRQVEKKVRSCTRMSDEHVDARSSV